MNETDSLFLLHVAQQTGQLGRPGFARVAKEMGFYPTMTAAKTVLNNLVAMRLLSETPGTAYLCVTIEGVETLRKSGRI